MKSIILSSEEVRDFRGGRTDPIPRPLKWPKWILALSADNRAEAERQLAEHAHLGCFIRRTVNVVFKCPYGRLGDTFWVKETWGIADSATYAPPTPSAYAYQADMNIDWRSSVHMPQEASRLTLRLDGIKVADAPWRWMLEFSVISKPGSG